MNPEIFESAHLGVCLKGTAPTAAVQYTRGRIYEMQYSGKEKDKNLPEYCIYDDTGQRTWMSEDRFPIYFKKIRGFNVQL